MVLAHGQSSICTILLQMTEEKQTILGKYYQCKEQIPAATAALQLSGNKIEDALCRIKDKTGSDQTLFLPLHHPKQIRKALHPEQGGRSPIDKRPCANLKDQLHPWTAGQYELEGIHSSAHSHGKGHGRHDIHPLAGYAVSQQLLVGPRIDEGTQEINDSLDGYKDERAELGPDHKSQDTDGLLYDLQFQEDIAAPHRVDGLEVGDVDGPEGVCNTHDPKIRHADHPFLPQQRQHHGIRHCKQPEQHGKHQEGTGPDGPAHHAPDLGNVPLPGGKCRQQHGLYGCPQVIDNQLGELVAPVIGAQQFLIINLPHD